MNNEALSTRAEEIAAVLESLMLDIQSIGGLAASDKLTAEERQELMPLLSKIDVAALAEIESQLLKYSDLV